MITAYLNGFSYFTDANWLSLKAKLPTLYPPVRGLRVRITAPEYRTEESTYIQLIDRIYEVRPSKAKIVFDLPQLISEGASPPYSDNKIDSLADAEWNLQQLLVISSGRIPDAFKFDRPYLFYDDEDEAKQVLRWYEQALYELGIYNRKIYVSPYYQDGWETWNDFTVHSTYGGRYGGRVFPKDIHYWFTDNPDRKFGINGGDHAGRAILSTKDCICSEAGYRLKDNDGNLDYDAVNWYDENVLNIHRQTCNSAYRLRRDLCWYPLFDVQSTAGGSWGLMSVSGAEGADFKFHPLLHRPLENNFLIIFADSGTKSFQIAGDKTAFFSVGDYFSVFDSEENDSTFLTPVHIIMNQRKAEEEEFDVSSDLSFYKCKSVSYSDETNLTTITVEGGYFRPVIYTTIEPPASPSVDESDDRVSVSLYHTDREEPYCYKLNVDINDTVITINDAGVGGRIYNWTKADAERTRVKEDYALTFSFHNDNIGFMGGPLSGL